MTWMLATSSAVIGTAQAAPIPYKRGDVHYVLQEKPLADFLSEFFGDQGLAVVISPQLRARAGTISGSRDGSPQRVFASIAGPNDIVSYYDGSTVYLYLSQERTTRYANLPPARVEDFVAAFQKMRLGDDANTFTATSGNGLVMITGVPRFIEQVQQLADAVNGQGPSTATVFKYYKLRYAWAADMTMTVGNRQQTIPGVATLLRELVSPAPQSPMATAQDRLLRPTQTKLRGQGLASVGQPPLVPSDGADARRDQADLAPAQPVSAAIDAGPNARIVADTFRNAIIVRDAPDRIGMYDRLIQSLDIEPQMVEIEATIIDIDKGKSKKLGIDWRWQNARTAVNWGRLGTPPDRSLATALGADNISLLNQLDGFQIGAIVGDGGKFIARINALATDDIANIISRPQVITLNDTEAVIENSQTVYVPVAGAYDVDLFNIVAGTVLRVTPHLIYENGRRRIRTMVQIEDGGVRLQQATQTGQTVTVPLVTRKAVNTQALIDEGQSLLLGGLISDSILHNDGKIPVLGDIPLIGNLFRQVEKEKERTERLFLITPRLVAMNRITTQQAPSSPDVSVEQIRADQEARDHAELPWASDAEKARYAPPPAPLPPPSSAVPATEPVQPLNPPVPAPPPAAPAPPPAKSKSTGGR
jgi:type III secretion protein C